MPNARHHAIIVTATHSRVFDQAHAKAVELGMEVSSIVKSPVNYVRTFMIAPDGSSDGWDDSNLGDQRRKMFIAWMDYQRYNDGSGPLSWVEVQYGDEDGDTHVVSHSDEAKHRLPGTLTLENDGVMESLKAGSPPDLRAIATIVRNDGKSKIHGAAVNGQMGDGGGSALIREADAFEAGLDQRLPESWSEYAAKHAREIDPEYADYLRMKAKFEARK